MAKGQSCILQSLNIVTNLSALTLVKVTYIVNLIKRPRKIVVCVGIKTECIS